LLKYESEKIPTKRKDDLAKMDNWSRQPDEIVLYGTVVEVRLVIRAVISTTSRAPNRVVNK
jgi:hypothetical protein